MTQSDQPCSPECQQVAKEWNLHQLFADLAQYKQQEKPRSKKLSDTEKKGLCLLLSEDNLQDIMIKMDKTPNSLKNFLSGLYYYISQLIDREIKDWRDVRRFLESDYKTPKTMKIKLEVNDINITVNFNNQSPKLQQFTATINISGWLQNEFEADWQNVEDILGTSKRNKDVRKMMGKSIVKRAKLLNYPGQLAEKSVVLIVAIQPELNQQVSIWIQVNPHRNETYLPPSLQLTLFSDSGEIMREMRSPTHANFMQLPLVKVQPGEKFSIGVALENVSFIEEFIVL
jgi:Protein of unknown function (DUF1822)